MLFILFSFLFISFVKFLVDAYTDRGNKKGEKVKVFLFVSKYLIRLKLHELLLLSFFFSLFGVTLVVVVCLCECVPGMKLGFTLGFGKL